MGDVSLNFKKGMHRIVNRIFFIYLWHINESLNLFSVIHLQSPKLKVFIKVFDLRLSLISTVNSQLTSTRGGW